MKDEVKKAKAYWNRETKRWDVMVWDFGYQDWDLSSSYPVKDIDPDTGYGFVSDKLLCKLYDLQDLGYQIEIKLK